MVDVPRRDSSSLQLLFGRHHQAFKLISAFSSMEMKKKILLQGISSPRGSKYLLSFGPFAILLLGFRGINGINTFLKGLWEP